MKYLLVAASILFSANAFAVIHGDPALDAKYLAVGALYMGEEPGVGCTATVVAGKWIVSAEHCTHAESGSEEEGDNRPLLPTEYEFRLGPDSAVPVFKTKLKRWVRGPKVKGEALDIAFGELASEVPFKKLNTAAVSMVTQKWDAADLLAPYIHIGYGTQDPFSQEVHPLVGKRQKAHLRVTAAEGNALLKLFGSEAKLEAYLNQFHPGSIDASSLDAIVAGGELIAPYYVHAWDPRGREDLNRITVPEKGWQDTCFGDSGGPLLREVNGQLVIVGVVSQGMDRVCSPFGTKFTIFGPKVREMMKKLGIN